MIHDEKRTVSTGWTLQTWDKVDGGWWDKVGGKPLGRSIIRVAGVRSYFG